MDTATVFKRFVQPGLLSGELLQELVDTLQLIADHRSRQGSAPGKLEEIGEPQIAFSMSEREREYVKRELAEDLAKRLCEERGYKW
jgi:hypothetical protein